ncbi:MAG TPA: low-complexity protein [Woeseiaceae bacterium]|nr:low-complexity protein [Woeseiaceae bacterium]
MSEKKVAKPVALAVGAALAGTFALGASANAEAGASPFAMTSLASGYMLGLGEGSCGGDKEGEKGEKEGEGACGEGSCGGDKKDKEGEGACGEGSCGGDAEGQEEGEEEGGEGA